MDSTTLRARFERRSGVNGKAAGIAVGAQLGEHRVGQALPLADVLKQARAHAAAQQGVQHVAGEPLLVRQRIGGHAQAQVHLLQRLLVAQGDARVRAGRDVRGRRRAGRQRFEMLAHQVHQAVVGQVAGRGDDQVGGRVDVRVVVVDGLAVEALHGLARAQDRLAERVVLPEVGRRRSRGPGNPGCPPPS